MPAGPCAMSRPGTSAGNVMRVPSRLRDWLAPTIPEVPNPTDRRTTHHELLIVFAITLGLQGIFSLISLLDSLLSPKPLNQQTVAINAPAAKAHLLDFFAQLTGVVQLLAWGALGLYLLRLNGIRLAAIGLDRTSPHLDLATGIGLTALIGIPGLAFYFFTRQIGINLTVAPSVLADTWWRTPVLLLKAAGNAWAEETLVVGYLLTRLRQLRWRENASLLTAAVLRGSYHLYQGFGGFLGNMAMGLVFGRVWQRTNRLWPLIIAHTLLDGISFVGYALLHGRTWL